MTKSDGVETISKEDSFKMMSELLHILKIVACHTRADCSPDEELTIEIVTERRANKETIRVTAAGVFLQPYEHSRVFDSHWLNTVIKKYWKRWNATKNEIEEYLKTTDVQGLLSIINRYDLKIEVDEEGTSFTWQQNGL